MKDDVAEHIDGLLEMAGLDGAIEYRIFLVGECVQLAAQSLDGVDNLYGAAMLGAFERQVLAEMGQSLLAR